MNVFEEDKSGLTLVGRAFIPYRGKVLSSAVVTNQDETRESGMMLKRLLTFGSLLVAIATTVGGGIANAQEDKLRFFVNFIGGPEIQFFAVVQRGVEDAGRDLGVDAIYSGPRCCDINLQAQLLKGGSRNWFRWLMGLWSRGQQTNVNGELRIG